MGDPFDKLGPMSGWGTFGDGQDDLACDAERRSMCEHFLRRMRKAEKRGGNATPDILAGGMTALAGLWFSAQGGPDNAKGDDYESFIAVATFAYYQAMGCFRDGAAVQ